jgi:hypothetical protein
MSKQLISKLIVQLYEKNYAEANTSLKNILEGKIASKAQKLAKLKQSKTKWSKGSKKDSKMGNKKNK